MSEDIDLDKIMADVFGAQGQTKQDQQFYVSYNEMNKIVVFGNLKHKENDGNQFIIVERDVFDELSNSTVGNYVVDADNNTVIDIAGNLTSKNASLPQVSKWAESSLVKLTFVKRTRQLHINVRTQLPAMKTVWLVPRANYMVPLLTIDLQSQGDTVLDVPKFNNSNSCQLLSQTPIEAFASYREVDNEKDL